MSPEFDLDINISDEWTQQVPQSALDESSLLLPITYLLWLIVMSLCPDSN